MDQRTADALDASIAHWEQNVAARTPSGVSTGSKDCALCNTFMNGRSCPGCPVSDTTGVGQCRGTPYYDARAALSNWVDDRAAEEGFRVAARAEVDFLKSLRQPVEDAP